MFNTTFINQKNHPMIHYTAGKMIHHNINKLLCIKNVKLKLLLLCFQTYISKNKVYTNE